MFNILRIALNLALHGFDYAIMAEIEKKVNVKGYSMEDLKDLANFKCPGCGKLVTAGFTKDDKPAICHPMPSCARFDAIDLDNPSSFPAFLREARMKAQN